MTTDIETSRVRRCIDQTIDHPRPKTVDVRELLNELVTDVEHRIDNGENPIDATWEVIENQEPQADLSHTERLYTVGFLFTNYGLDEPWLTEDRRVTHAEKWDNITFTLCEYALYDIVHGLATGEIEPDPHSVGEFNDSRTGSYRRDFSDDLLTDPLRNTDVHNWIASLAGDVSARLANHDNVPADERTDMQKALTNAANETEAEAIRAVIDEQARDELLTGNIITAASFLDALEDLYEMDGVHAIEHEQLSKTAESEGWHSAVTSGILWHAMETAIKVHREAFADEFKQTIDR